LLCVLHNYLRKVGFSYIIPTTFDRENGVTHELEQGNWREESTQLLLTEYLHARNAPIDAKENRENYTKFFKGKGKGKVPWQNEMLWKGKAQFQRM
jgi:hypothetical protein